MLTFLFLFWIYIRGHPSRSCLPFFSFSRSIFVVTRGDLDFLYFYFRVDLRGHTRRFWLPLFSVSGSIFVDTQGDRDCLYFLFLDRSSFGDTLVRFFPVGIRDWRVFPSSMLFLVWPVPLFIVPVSYRCTVITWSCTRWSLGLTYITKLLSCSFPVEILSCYSAVTRELWVW